MDQGCKANNSLPSYVQKIDSGKWRVWIWVQPKAKEVKISGMYQNCLKIKLQSPPVDDKANKELVKFVAGKLGLKSIQVNLESGQTSRKKALLIENAQEPLWRHLSG